MRSCSSRRSRTTRCASCISASSARRSAASRRRSRRRSIRSAIFSRRCSSRCAAREQPTRVRCTLLQHDVARISGNGPAGVRALLSSIRDRACASCCGACMATRGTSGARISRRVSEMLERAAVLGELRDRLRRAIESEQFELAADLRDRAQGDGMTLDLSLLPDGGVGWLDASGEHSDIVLSTRIRLARNVEGYAFTGRARDGERLRCCRRCARRCGTMPSLRETRAVSASTSCRRRPAAAARAPPGEQGAGGARRAASGAERRGRVSRATAWA